MLLQGTVGNSEKARGVGRAQESGRQAWHRIVHRQHLQFKRSRAVGGDSASWLTVAEKRWLGACRICADVLTAPRKAKVELYQPGFSRVYCVARVLPAGQLDRVVQQRSVIAPHHALARCHETARLVFARIAFPIGLGATKAKERLADGSVALAALARVEGTQCQNMQLPELSWHRPKGAAGRPAVESAPQSPCRMRA